jgi:hypothetical protein
MFLQSVADILNRMIETVIKDDKEYVENGATLVKLETMMGEIAALIEYTNECFCDVSHIFHCVRYAIHVGENKRLRMATVKKG